MRKEEFYKIYPKDRLKEYVNQTRTPCYIYFREIIQKQYDTLKNCLPDDFKINYAIKANPNKDVLKFLQFLGTGADVGSIGELKLAVESGFLPEEIEFTGPGKTLEELDGAIECGIFSINVESVSEIKKICRLSEQKKKMANVGIRLNPRYKSKVSAIRMNENTQFGIIEDDMGEAFEIMNKNRELLNFRGFHLHLGSQIMKTEGILSNFRFILEKVYKIVKSYGITVGKINFGGGWGVDMFGNETLLDFPAIRRGMADMFSNPEYKVAFKDTNFIVEPGRFLVAECGVYAVPVLYKKRGYNKEFLIVEGGMHHHFAAAGGIGQIIKRNYEIDAISNIEKSGQNETEYTIAGSLCLPADVLASNIKLKSDISEGDTLIFYNSGAYALSTSPVLFLGHTPPNEFLF